jgi:hypothetical protein
LSKFAEKESGAFTVRVSVFVIVFAGTTVGGVCVEIEIGLSVTLIVTV